MLSAMFQPSYPTMLSSDQNQQTAHGQSPAPKRNARRILACCAKLILLLDIIATATKVMTTMVSAKTCVETEENTFLCTDNTRKAQRSTRKTYMYYLQHFGIPQMIEGNEEEMRKMKIKNSEMEGYFKGWVGRVNGMKGGERLKERCINNNSICVFWSTLGECEKNPVFMNEQCMLACHSCDILLLNDEL